MRSTRILRLAVILAITVCVTMLITSALRWRGASPKKRFDIGHAGWELAVLRDRTVVVSSLDTVTGWNVDTESRLFEVVSKDPIRSVVAGWDGGFYVLDEEGGLAAFDGHGQPSSSVATSARGLSFQDGRLATTDDGGRLDWLDPVTLLPSASEPQQLPGPADLIDHKGTTVCVGAFQAGELQFFERKDQWSLPIERVGAVAISADQKWIGVVTWRGELHLIDRQQRCVAWRKELAYKGQMKSVRFNPAGDRVVTCSPTPGRIWVLECATGNVVLESSVGGDPIEVDFLDNQTIVALHQDGDVRLWELK